MLLRNGIAYQDVVKETSRIYQNYTQQVPTASGPDFLRTANELVSVKGTLAGADLALVQSLKIEGLVSNATGKSAEGQGYDLWRAVEDAGKIQNKAETDRLLGAMTTAITATGGKISGSDFFTYARRANTAWKHDDVESMPLQVLEMQTLGASGAGVGRSAFANRVEGDASSSPRRRKPAGPRSACWSGTARRRRSGIAISKCIGPRASSWR